MLTSLCLASYRPMMLSAARCSSRNLIICFFPTAIYPSSRSSNTFYCNPVSLFSLITLVRRTLVNRRRWKKLLRWCVKTLQTSQSRPSVRNISLQLVWRIWTNEKRSSLTKIQICVS